MSTSVRGRSHCKSDTCKHCRTCLFSHITYYAPQNALKHYTAALIFDPYDLSEIAHVLHSNISAVLSTQNKCVCQEQERRVWRVCVCSSVFWP